MKHISELTTQPRQESQGQPNIDAASEKPLPQPQPDRLMDRLWTRMTRIYGHRWTSSFGDGDDGTWAMGLHDILPTEIAHGLSACVTRDHDWPPSLPEFRHLCRPEAETVKACQQPYSALPRPNVDREKVLTMLAGLHDMLQ